MLYECASHFCEIFREVIRKNGKKQTLTAQSQVIGGPYVFENSAASIRTVARRHVFL